MSNEIVNNLKSSELDILAVTDPSQLRFHIENLAKQINAQRMKYRPQKRWLDLGNRIGDIVIETSAQGASLIEVHVIDPEWLMFQRDRNGVCFIDADEDGYLWPPIEVQFPSDRSDSKWRLCQAKPSTDLDTANVILTFEDKIASQLREHGGPVAANGDESRAAFIKRLITYSNQHPAVAGDEKIRFVSLLPASEYDASSLTGNLPSSATNPSSPARGNPHKRPSGKPPPNAPVWIAPGITLAAGPEPGRTE